MKRNKLIGIFAFAMIAVLGVSMVSAFGFGNGFIFSNLEDKESLQEQREAIRSAIEEGDYLLWKSLMEERIAQMQEMLTLENFNELTKRHSEREEFRVAMQEAKESGDFSKVSELREQYGLEKGFGKYARGFAKGFGMGKGSCLE